MANQDFECGKIFEKVGGKKDKIFMMACIKRVLVHLYTVRDLFSQL